MRLLILPPVALLLLLTGCGSDDSANTATKPPSVTSAATEAPTTSAAQILSPAPTVSPMPEGFVSKAGLGVDWPLRVPSGVLACNGSDGFGEATITTGGKKYALNGIAQKSADAIDPIWAPDPENPGAKKDLGVLITLALALCK